MYMNFPLFVRPMACINSGMRLSILPPEIKWSSSASVVNIQNEETKSTKCINK